MAKDHSARGETHSCHFMGYSFWVAARYPLYIPSHRQTSTHHSLCLTCWALAGMRNNSRVHYGKLIWQPIRPWADTLLCLTLILFLNTEVKCTTVIECSLVVQCVVRSIPHGGSLSYFSFQPVLHDWYNKGC